MNVLTVWLFVSFGPFNFNEVRVQPYMYPTEKDCLKIANSIPTTSNPRVYVSCVETRVIAAQPQIVQQPSIK